MFVTKAAEQQPPRFVVTDHADGQDVDSQIREIIDCVRSATGDYGALAMTQNQHWGFTRDSRNFTEHEFVGHHITENGDGDSPKRLDDLAEAVGRFAGAIHWSQWSVRSG